MDYPPTIPIASLLKTHPEYDLQSIQKSGDIYYGGKRFNKNKCNYLMKTPYEMSSKPGAVAYFKSRCDCAVYVPLASGRIDHFVAATNQAPASILATCQADPKQAEYYNGLNDNCGSGMDIAAFIRERHLSASIYNRAYIGLKWPVAKSDSAYVGPKKAAGDLNVSWTPIDAIDVDDWRINDDDGKFDYVREHGQCLTVKDPVMRSLPWVQPDVEMHTWVMYTRDAIVEYQCALELVSGIPRPFDPNKDIATRTRVMLHDLKRVPIVQVKTPFCIMDRLSDTAIAQFNARANLTWALRNSAINIPYIKTDKPVAEVMMNEEALFVFDADWNEFGWSSPPTSAFEELRLDNIGLEKELDAVITTTALGVDNSTQNMSRLSGVARIQMYGAIAVLLELNGGGLKDTINEILEITRLARGGDENVQITLGGLDRFDPSSLADIVNNTIAYLSIQGGSETAKAYAKSKLDNIFTDDASTTIKTQVQEEIADTFTAIKDAKDNPVDVNDIVPNPQAGASTAPQGIKPVPISPGATTQFKQDYRYGTN